MIEGNSQHNICPLRQIISVNVNSLLFYLKCAPSEMYAQGATVKDTLDPFNHTILVIYHT